MKYEKAAAEKIVFDDSDVICRSGHCSGGIGWTICSGSGGQSGGAGEYPDRPDRPGHGCRVLSL